jgi:hypothetical protein
LVDEQQSAIIAAKGKAREGLAKTLLTLIGKPVKHEGRVAVLETDFYGSPRLTIEARADEAGVIKSALVAYSYGGKDGHLIDLNPDGEDMRHLQERGVTAETVHGALTR